MKKYIPCKACSRNCLIANVTLYQTHWYVRPHGCTGGDYWSEGECQFVCHHCNVANRLLCTTQYDHKREQHVSKQLDLFRWEYRKTFKSIVETHEDEEEPTHTHKWVNNYWIDSL